jgi:aminoglycoside/choline kinase family phosphotransferase
MIDSSELRSAALWSWFASLCPTLALGLPQGGIQPVSGDASFRRYFRGVTDKGSWILVDAPPEKENSRPFVAVQHSLHAGGVAVPQVLAADLDQGFMCLQDFGSELLLPSLLAIRSEHAGALQDTLAADLYQLAFAQLLLVQRCDPRQPPLPLYDRAMLLREMQLFSEWLCKGILQLDFSTEEAALWQAVQECLIASALAQPQVYVHRDYHSRNLMLVPGGLGVLDFQDAVLGPFTYDLVSLLKDCYIAWPAEQVRALALDYLRLAQQNGIASDISAPDFLTDFDLMGVQRHLKAAGIFCRLWLRDGKPGYLQDIPRTLAYITTIPFADATMREFSQWLQTRVLPGLVARLEALGAAAIPDPAPAAPQAGITP